MKDDLTPARPTGLVPGTPQWLIEIQGPILIKRLVAEIEAQEVGKMNPTGARLLGMAIDRIMPSLTAIHHTGDTPLRSFSDDELKEKLRLLLGEKEAATFDLATVETVEFKETLAGSGSTPAA